MRRYRPLRLEAVIQEELGKIILKEMEFPTAQLITITNVAVSNNLEKAKIKISVIPATSSQEVMDILIKAIGHLQHLLNKKLNIRPMPRIEFEVDYGPAKVAEIEKIFLKSQ